MTETETLYRKVGRRYQPVAEMEHYSADIWSEGAHLTLCTPGIRFARFKIEPDKAGLLAALYQHREAVINAISSSSAWEMQRASRESRRVKAARDAYIAAVGDTLTVFDGPSASKLLDAIVKIVEGA